jgi:hypothetical protein
MELGAPVIVAIVCLAVLLLAVTIAAWFVIDTAAARGNAQVNELLNRHDAERQRWEDERRELLNRFTHPERMPVGRRTAVAPQPPEESPVDVARRRAMSQIGRAHVAVSLPGDQDQAPA